MIEGMALKSYWFRKWLDNGDVIAVPSQVISFIEESSLMYGFGSRKVCELLAPSQTASCRKANSGSSCRIDDMDVELISLPLVLVRLFSWDPSVIKHSEGP